MDTYHTSIQCLVFPWSSFLWSVRIFWLSDLIRNQSAGHRTWDQRKMHSTSIASTASYLTSDHYYTTYMCTQSFSPTSYSMILLHVKVKGKAKIIIRIFWAKHNSYPPLQYMRKSYWVQASPTKSVKRKCCYLHIHSSGLETSYSLLTYCVGI